jgi:hypothetical protein
LFSGFGHAVLQTVGLQTVEQEMLRRSIVACYDGLLSMQAKFAAAQQF